MTEVEVHGDCDERYAAVRKVLEDNLAGGADLGASVAVFVDGEPVVDIWGGWADETVGTRHAGQRLVDDQDDDCSVGAGAGRRRRSRLRRTGVDVLAGVRGG